MNLIYLLILFRVVKSAFYQKKEESFSEGNIILQQNAQSLLQCTHLCKRNDPFSSVWFDKSMCECVKVKTTSGRQQSGKKTVKGELLQLKEIKELQNIALNKPSFQTSTWLGRADSLAKWGNDGNLKTHAITNTGNSAWVVNLEKDVWIARVELFFRHHELNVAKTIGNVRVLTTRQGSEELVLCNDVGTPASTHVVVSCKGFTKAQFVRIEQNNQHVIVLLEAKVYGYE